ncbi:hypothetical protein [Anatilimnocola floriformis]|uniref:hypothetical protein n=1 Tax=Anatilimnocola floriformis TaxID=2948575 RepID=UPI0020C52F5B|nr:hypothetical protein [Anatilimnocola floriformis]
MSGNAFRYDFGNDVPMEEVQASILLAVLGCESLHGETGVHLNATYSLDVAGRTCVVDVSNDVGSDLNRLFAGFVRREFGRGKFSVKRIEGLSAIKR